MTRAELLLTQLAEEAAEVVQEASKCLRFGPNEVYLPAGISNAERVMVELQDVIAVVEMLQDEGVLSDAFNRNDAMVVAKKAKVEKLLAYSSELGILQ